MTAIICCVELPCNMKEVDSGSETGEKTSRGSSKSKGSVCNERGNGGSRGSNSGGKRKTSKRKSATTTSGANSSKIGQVVDTGFKISEDCDKVVYNNSSLNRPLNNTQINGDGIGKGGSNNNNNSRSDGSTNVENCDEQSLFLTHHNGPDRGSGESLLSQNYELLQQNQQLHIQQQQQQQQQQQDNGANKNDVDFSGDATISETPTLLSNETETCSETLAFRQSGTPPNPPSLPSLRHQIQGEENHAEDQGNHSRASHHVNVSGACESYSPLLGCSSSSSSSPSTSCAVSGPPVILDSAAKCQTGESTQAAKVVFPRSGDSALTRENFKIPGTILERGDAARTKNNDIISNNDRNSINVNSNSISGFDHSQDKSAVRYELTQYKSSDHDVANDSSFPYLSNGAMFHTKVENGIPTASLTLPNSTSHDEIDVKPNFELLNIDTAGLQQRNYGSEYHQHQHLQHYHHQQHHYLQQQQQHFSAASPPEHRLYPDEGHAEETGKRSSSSLDSISQHSFASPSGISQSYFGAAAATSGGQFFSSSHRITPSSYEELASMSDRKFYVARESNMAIDNINQDRNAQRHDNQVDDGGVDERVTSGDPIPQGSEIYYQQDSLYQQHQLKNMQSHRHSAAEMSYDFDTSQPMSSYTSPILTTEAHNHLAPHSHHLQHQSHQQNPLPPGPPQNGDHLENLNLNADQNRDKNNSGITTESSDQHQHHHHDLHQYDPRQCHSQLQQHLQHPHHLSMPNEEHQSYTHAQEIPDPSCSMAGIPPHGHLQQHFHHQYHRHMPQEHSPGGENTNKISSSNTGSTTAGSSSSNFKYDPSQHHLHTLTSVSLPIQDTISAAAGNTSTPSDCSSDNNSNNNINSTASNYHLTSISPATASSESLMYPTPTEAAVAVYPHHPHHSHYHHHNQHQHQHHMHLQNVSPRESAIYNHPNSEVYGFDEASTSGNSAGIQRDGMDLSTLQPFSSGGVMGDIPISKEHHSNHHGNGDSSPSGAGCVDNRKPMAMIYPWMKKSQTGKCK